MTSVFPIIVTGYIYCNYLWMLSIIKAVIFSAKHNNLLGTTISKLYYYLTLWHCHKCYPLLFTPRMTCALFWRQKVFVDATSISVHRPPLKSVRRRRVKGFCLHLRTSYNAKSVCRNCPKNINNSPLISVCRHNIPKKRSSTRLKKCSSTTYNPFCK